MRKFDRNTVRAVMDLMVIEGAGFYFNEPNNYGCITGKIFTGKGDAGLFCGEELKSTFRDGVRGNGNYRLNEAGIDRIMKLLDKQARAALTKTPGTTQP